MKNTNSNINNQVSIVITSYNCETHINGLLKSIVLQDYNNIQVVVADDGSSDQTVKVIKSFQDKLNIDVLELEHGERGIARYMAISKAIESDPAYLLIIDADMMLQKNLITEVTQYMKEHQEVDALAIKEIPYSSYKNFFTKVKLFERKVINNGRVVDPEHSIEAARFWKCESFVKTGGINQNQIAFEEIQPTLRCFDQGGTVHKLLNTGLYHDEKKVTLKNIIEKKNYYFSKLSITVNSEKQGFAKTLKRWYLFRPVYYNKNNLIEYMKHPILFVGMVFMYIVLTLIGVYHMLSSIKLKILRKEVA